jgi:hypothetical protein
MLSAAVFAKDGNRDYEVTVTNITKGQSFTPFLVVSHKPDISLFTPGEAAWPELATLAESGDTSGLQALLDGMPDLVLETKTTMGLLAPGEEVTIEISGDNRYSRLSFAAMLIPTNDTFVGLNSEEFPKRETVVMVPAYDAGSEENDELCDNIPGPVCMDMDDDGNTGEGYIYVGNGIRGGGDLSPNDYDWNNPVARVVVRRIH